VVIIPFLRLSDKSLEKPYFDGSGEKIKLLNVSENIAKFSQEARLIYEKQKTDSLLSELNVVYVSMTRAQYEFYAVVPYKSGKLNNMIPLLFKGKSLVSGAKRAYNLNAGEEDGIVSDVFKRGYKDVQKYLRNADKTKLDIRGVRKKGLIIHYALSKIKSLKNKNIDEAVGCALEFAKRKFFFEDVEFAREELYRLFSSEKVLSLFMYDDSCIYNEKEVVNAAGETFRIDKLIINKDEVIIADFKSSGYGKKENKKQIKSYAGLISEIYPGKKITACILDVKNAEVVECIWD